MAWWSNYREVFRRIFSDIRSYYLAAAIVVFFLLARRADQMRVGGILGHVAVLILLLGGIWLEYRRQALSRELEQASRDREELHSRVRELEAIVLSHGIQKETERLRPHVEEIQRRLLAEFPDYMTSFAVAEKDGYVYPDELVMTARTQDGQELPPEEYKRMIEVARQIAKELHPDLAIHWA